MIAGKLSNAKRIPNDLGMGGVEPSVALGALLVSLLENATFRDVSLY